MSMGQSWFGPASEVKKALEANDAAKGENGSYLIKGPPLFFGIGGDEVIVSFETEVQVRGEWVKLAKLLSPHVSVMVF